MKSPKWNTIIINAGKNIKSAYMRRLLCLLGYLLVVIGSGFVVLMFFLTYKEYLGGNELMEFEIIPLFVTGAFFIILGLYFIKEYKERL